MKTVTKIIFTSILSAVAPTFAHAAYLQSHAPYQQSARQIGVTTTATKQVPAARAVRGLDAMAYSPAVFAQSFAPGNTSVPGIGVLKDDTIPYGK
jgi:hypothetical protein